MSPIRVGLIAFLLLAVFLVRSAGAQPAAGTAAIAPFIDETALLVGEIDITAIEPTAVFDWMIDLGKLAGQSPEDQKKMARDLGGATPQVKSWISDFSKAGGKKIYFIAIANQKSPFYAVIPTTGADAGKLKELIETGLPKNMTGNTVVLQTEKGLIWGPKGSVDIAKEIAGNPDRTTRPDVTQAFAATGEGPVRVVFTPPEAIKGALILAQPTLPPQLGGGSTGSLVNSFKYAALSLDLPTRLNPKAGLKMTIQARDETGAKKLLSTLDALWKTAKNEPTFGKMSEADKLIAMLTPTAAGDRLLLAFDQTQIETMAKTLAPGLIAARQQAARIQSMSNLRQIAMAVMQYSNDNKGGLPVSFPGDLTPYLADGQAATQVLTNPVTGRFPGYVYLRPAAAKIQQVPNPAESPMAHEVFDAWPIGGVAVAFWDGHVEIVAQESAFKKLTAAK